MMSLSWMWLCRWKKMLLLVSVVPVEQTSLAVVAATKRVQRKAATQMHMAAGTARLTDTGQSQADTRVQGVQRVEGVQRVQAAGLLRGVKKQAVKQLQTTARQQGLARLVVAEQTESQQSTAKQRVISQQRPAKQRM